MVAPVATPHGLVCLITAAAGSSNSRTMRAAASRSSRLVNESSLPCRIGGRAESGRRVERVPRRRLMRVFAVAEIAELARANRSAAWVPPRSCASAEAWGPGRKCIAFDRHLTQRRRDRGVVGAGVFEGAAGQLEAERRRRPAGAIELGDHRVVVLRRTTIRTSRKFFAAARTRLGPPMSICSIRSSNWMPGFAAVSTNGYRLTTTRSTRPMPCCVGELQVLGMMAAREDAAVDLGMERLDPAVHHFGKAGDIADVDHRQPRLGQGLGRAAGRDQLEAARRRAPCQMKSGRFCRKHSESHAASMKTLYK